MKIISHKKTLSISKRRVFHIHMIHFITCTLYRRTDHTTNLLHKSVVVRPQDIRLTVVYVHDFKVYQIRYRT